MSEKISKKRKRIHIRFSKTQFHVGDEVPRSAIYECSECENVTAFKRGETFIICENCDDKNPDQHWHHTNEFIRFVSKNLNTEFDRIEGMGLKASDIIATLAGSLWFVFLHVIWFGWWVYVNTGHESFGLMDFDVYPFGLLTMIVSLEAIFLSTFILISQNRQSDKSELRAELDYQTNLNTEKDVAEVLSILRDVREEGRTVENNTFELLQKIASDLDTKRKDRRKKIQRPRKSREAKIEKKVDEIMENAGIEDVSPEEGEEEEEH